MEFLYADVKVLLETVKTFTKSKFRNCGELGYKRLLIRRLNLLCRGHFVQVHLKKKV